LYVRLQIPAVAGGLYLQQRREYDSCPRDEKLVEGDVYTIIVSGSNVPTSLSRLIPVNPKQQLLPFLRSFKKPQQPIRKVGTMKTLTRTCLEDTSAGY
jgi:hypothetical protein